MACAAESLRRVRLTHADNEEPRFPDSVCQSRIVTIARNEAESLYDSLMEDVHRVDDHRAVGCILPRYVGELLLRLEGVLLEDRFPLTQLSRGPVPRYPT